jgi:drug/metabolite transporter superfamily protein YnfA
LGGGWLELARKREGVVSWVIAGGMLSLALYALFGVLLPAFHPG